MKATGAPDRLLGPLHPPFHPPTPKLAKTISSSRGLESAKTDSFSYFTRPPRVGRDRPLARCTRLPCSTRPLAKYGKGYPGQTAFPLAQCIKPTVCSMNWPTSLRPPTG